MKKRIITIILFLFIHIPAFCHDGDYTLMFVNVPYTYDFKNKTNSYGLDLNYVALFFNCGAECKIENYRSQNKSNVNGYIGLGLVNLLQLQAGYSSNNYGVIRLKSEWRIADLDLFGVINLNKDLELLENISLKVNVDRTIFSNKTSWFGSIGIGLSWPIK